MSPRINNEFQSCQREQREGTVAKNQIFPHKSGYTASIFTKTGIQNSSLAGFVLKQTDLKSIDNSRSNNTKREKDNQMGLYSDFTYFYRLLPAACQQPRMVLTYFSVPQTSNITFMQKNCSWKAVEVHPLLEAPQHCRCSSL